MRKGIYITIPKTAQTSLMSVFDSSELKKSILTINTNGKKGLFGKNHNPSRIPTFNFSISTAQWMKNKLGKKVWNNAFKFGFVRNPWDRYVSNWKWLTRKDPSGRGWNFRGFKSPEGTVSFEEFVEEISIAYEFNDPGYQHDRWHICNQIEHIIDNNNKIMLDHVARFENFEKELSNIFSILNIKQPKIPHLNYRGYHNGNDFTPSPHYSTYYNDKLINIVGERCEPDIKAFNYAFERV
tara:strand:+ start:101 stop:817 length:717 start_codon:yes stop_codon:yes gene_type:complete